MQMRATLLSVVMVCAASAAHAQELELDVAALDAEVAPEAEAAPEADLANDANDVTELTPPPATSLPATSLPATAPTAATTPPRPSRVDSSAPLSGGERWVKDNGRWKLQRVNYRYLDHADYAPRPPPPPTINDFPEPRVALSTRWFGSSGWGWRATPVWGFGWNNGWGSGWGMYSRSPWSWGVSPWSPWGYGGWRGVPRYGWGNRGWGNYRGFGGRSRFGFSFGWGSGLGY